ncbi:MAG: hypothetical protein AB1427_16750 [Thermodesulfobacteriota bacterium]
MSRFTCVIILYVVLSLYSGCRTLNAPRIQPESILLSGGSRLLIADAIGQGFKFKIAPRRQAISVPGLCVVVPAQQDVAAISNRNLVAPVISEKRVDPA